MGFSSMSDGFRPYFRFFLYVCVLAGNMKVPQNPSPTRHRLLPGFADARRHQLLVHFATTVLFVLQSSRVALAYGPSISARIPGGAELVIVTQCVFANCRLCNDLREKHNPYYQTYENCDYLILLAFPQM